MELLGYLLSILIGISLGLIGGGGAILTMPILVYLFGIEPQLATSYSLFIVGITALFGAIRHYALGNLNWKSGLYFGIPSVFSLLVIRKFILPRLPNNLISLHDFQVSKQIFLMVLFAILMLAASISMIRKSNHTNQEGSVHFAFLSVLGIFVGTITGLLGAGGGFLIIPSLVIFAKIDIKKAIGTSLLIIAFNSLIGFVGDLLNHIKLDFLFLSKISLIAIVGMFVGAYISNHIDGRKLKPAFGWFVFIMGIYILIKEFNSL